MKELKRNKKLFLIISILVVAGGIFAWQVVSQGKEGGDNTPFSEKNIPAVETVKVKEFQQKETKLSSIGKVEALQEVDLRSQLSANVKRVNVNIGEEVEKGEVLVELDHSDLDAELDRARASIKRLESQLAQQKAGATSEQILKASTSVEQAEAALDQVRSQLEQTRVNNEAMVKNAEIGVELARVNLESNTTSTKQQLENAYDSLKLASSNLLSTIRTALVTAGDILGKKPGDENVNNIYEDFLGAKNSQAKRDAEINFSKAREAYEEAREYKESLPENISIEQGEELDRLVGEALDYTDQALNDLKITLDNTITTQGFPRTSATGLSLQGLKDQVNTQISYINQAQKNLQTQRQAVTNAEISSDNTSEQTRLNYEQSLQELENSRQKAQANLESARSSVQAQEKALQQARASYEEVVADPREVDLASVRASIEEAEANERSVLDKLDKAYIRAPFSGEVGSVPVSLNELVNPGDVVVSLVNKSGLQVRSYISPEDKKFVKNGAEVEVGSGASGVVSQISSQVDPQTKKIELITAVTEESSDLVVGEYVELSIRVTRQKEDDPFLLPFRAVKVTPEGNYVFVVNEDDKIEKKEVELGRVVNEYNEVTKGLDSDMEIIANVRGLSEGQRVEVK